MARKEHFTTGANEDRSRLTQFADNWVLPGGKPKTKLGRKVAKTLDRFWQYGDKPPR